MCFIFRCEEAESRFQPCPPGRKFQKQTNALTMKDISQQVEHIWDFLRKRKIIAKEQKTIMKSNEH
jgi:hypothetical protein